MSRLLALLAQAFRAVTYRQPCRPRNAPSAALEQMRDRTPQTDAGWPWPTLHKGRV